jgi:Domain of unknown function (DUF7014)/AbiJ N-terminal domain 4
VPIYDLFSKRKRQGEKEGKADVYQYDDLPQPFRVQVAHIWRTAIGPYGVDRLGIYEKPASNAYWNFILDAVCREKGVFTLSGGVTPIEQCVNYVLQAPTEDALDIIEMSFRIIDRVVRKAQEYGREGSGIKQEPDDAIEELNQRFREHGIGYQYVNGIIIRVDSQYIHADVVKPALSLLGQPGFEGPEEEFVKAFDHYRKGNDKEAVAEALKAFESTMKAICKNRRWTYSENATAKPLLDLLFANGLIPPELQAYFGGLRSTLESGLPTLSNRTSRHGQGADPRPIPPHYAAYALHLAAASIVFLVEAHKAKA